MISKTDIVDGFKFMLDDYEYTVHKLSSDVMYLTMRCYYEGKWFNKYDRPNIDIKPDHLELFMCIGNTVLHGKFYYSVLKPVTEPEPIPA